ncbi:MAG TPA: magnesium transporter [Candidatus Polarisedimenticolia bacterium]|nr:magnesium transporter [Candidatus Polarisedimenticolia bacterium]
MKDSTFLVESVKKLLRRGATTHLLNMLQKVRAADLAEAFKLLDEDDRASAFRLLAERATGAAAALLGEIHPTLRADLVRGMAPEEMARVLQTLASDDVAEILAVAPAEDRQRILSLMQREASEEVQDLLEYEDETAGRIMTTRFLALPEATSVQEAITAVQKAQEAEMVFYLYVVDAHGHLHGVLSLRRLLTVPPETRLRDIMASDVITVRAETDQEEVARIVSRYDLLAVPVVDAENILVGIVTVDDVVDVMREEATEDFYKLAGTSDEERLTKSTLRSAQVRVPWMLAAFVGGTLAALVIKQYDAILGRATVLACFIPVVLGMGGNIGTQAATIMVRGLSTGRISLRQTGGVIFKEIRIALLLGLLFGALLGLVAVLLVGLRFPAGLIVGLSLWVSMALAAVVGSVLPMLLKVIHVDPAVATSPFVTTAVDLLGLLALFGLVGPRLVAG